ncbi:hypothetical protein Tco_0779467 [Tanacetum coccineum]
MTTTAAQQVALGNELVPLENRKDSTSYQFKIDKKMYKIDMEVFREIFQICPRLPTQEFDALPLDEEIISFIKELGHKGDIKSSIEVFVAHMYQPWRTFAAIINKMTNQQMWDSTAFKTYLAYATGTTSPKMKRKFKKPASPSKKKSLVVVDERADKPVKKPAAKRQSVGGADFKSKVPNELNGKSIDTSEGTGLKLGVPNVSKADYSENSDDEPQYVDDERIDSDNQETNDDEEKIENEFVHTPPNYVPSDDETNDESNDVTKEEYERINEELYGDVNVSLTDDEPADKEKDDEEMIVAGHVNVNQEGACNQVNDDAQATQKTKVPLPSSSISSDYAAKFLNFDNIPPANTKVISMLDINVQREVPRTSSLLTILVIVDLEKDVKEIKDVDNSSKVISMIKSEVPNVVKEYLGSNLDDALHKVIQRNFADIIKEHSVPAEIIKRLRHQYAPQKSIEDIREIKMEHLRKQQVPKETITSSDTTTLEEFDQKTTLFETMTKSKSFNKNTGNTDEPPVVNVDPKDWFKKPERPPTPDPEWNEGKSAENKPTQKWLSGLAKAEKPSRTFADLMNTPIDFSAFVMNSLQISELTQDILVGPAYNILKGICISYVELDYNMEECYKSRTDQLDWNNPKGNRYPFNLSKPPPLVMSGNRQIVPVDYFFNNNLAYLQGGSTRKTYTTLLTKTRAVKYDLPEIEDMSTKRILAVTNVKVKEWYGYGHLENNLFNLKGDVIVHLAAALRTLISLHDTLKDMVNNLEMGYTSVMQRRRWSNLDKKRSRIMIKDIDCQLLDRRLMRSLEKFVGGRYYEENPRLLQRTI